MKKNKHKLIAYFAVVILLLAVFWYGADAPGHKGLDFIKEEDRASEETIQNGDLLPDMTESPKETASKKTEEPSLAPSAIPDKKDEKENKPANTKKPEEDKKEDIKKDEDNKITGRENNTDEEKSPEKTEETKDGKKEIKAQNKYVSGGDIPPPADLDELKISDEEHRCFLSVRCDTAVRNIEKISEEKRGLIPPNGEIFPEKEVIFFDGETAFNILLREMKKNGIHMEYVNVPLYKSAYIEGINNLYEFDCGELSGWMYRVNGLFPDYGCSGYLLHEGDRVEFIYTCALGEDIK